MFRRDTLIRVPGSWSLFTPQTLTNLRYELEDGVGEKCPDGEADEVGQHFGEVRFLGEGDQQEAEQGRQVDHSDRQKPITPHYQGSKGEETVTHTENDWKTYWLRCHLMFPFHNLFC